jgi:hypothetical protein
MDEQQKKIDRITGGVHVDFYAAERGRKFSIDGKVTPAQLRAIADVAEEMSFKYAKKPEAEKKEDKRKEDIGTIVVVVICVVVLGWFMWACSGAVGDITKFMWPY